MKFKKVIAYSSTAIDLKALFSGQELASVLTILQRSRLSPADRGGIIKSMQGLWAKNLRLLGMLQDIKTETDSLKKQSVVERAKQQAKMQSLEMRMSLLGKRPGPVRSGQSRRVPDRLMGDIQQSLAKISRSFQSTVDRMGKEFIAQVSSLRADNKVMSKKMIAQTLFQETMLENRANLPVILSKLKRAVEIYPQLSPFVAKFLNKPDVKGETIMTGLIGSPKSGLIRGFMQLGARQISREDHVRSLMRNRFIGEKELSALFLNARLGRVPALPGNIDSILKKRCPFNPGLKVSDTHILFLLPATVGRQVFNIATLSDLLGKGRYKSEHGPVNLQLYNFTSLPFVMERSTESKWCLIPGKIVRDSINKASWEQKHFINLYTDYKQANALQVVAGSTFSFLLTGERLYTPYTVCTSNVLKPPICGGHDHWVHTGFGYSKDEIEVHSSLMGAYCDSSIKTIGVAFIRILN